MRTHTHLLVTAALGRQLQRRGTAVDMKAFLTGAVLPDIPLTALSLGYKAVTSLRRSRADAATAASDRFNIGCGELFNSNPYWIVSYNLLHAPLVIGLLLLVSDQGQQRDQRWAHPLRWLALGFALHSAADIPTHHDDGPLPLFPLNWRYRFRSPISYWDSTHHGQLVTVLEAGLDALIVAGFIREGVRAWLTQRS